MQIICLTMQKAKRNDNNELEIVQKLHSIRYILIKYSMSQPLPHTFYKQFSISNILRRYSTIVLGVQKHFIFAQFIRRYSLTKQNVNFL